MPDVAVGRQTFTTAATQLPYQVDELEIEYLLVTGLVPIPIAADSSKAKVTTPVARVHAEYTLKILRFQLLRINALPTLPSSDRTNPQFTLLRASIKHHKPGRTVEGYPIYHVEGMYVWLLNQPLFETDGFPGVESPVMVNSPTVHKLTPDLFTTLLVDV